MLQVGSCPVILPGLGAVEKLRLVLFTNRMVQDAPK